MAQRPARFYPSASQNPPYTYQYPTDNNTTTANPDFQYTGDFLSIPNDPPPYFLQGEPNLDGWNQPNFISNGDGFGEIEPSLLEELGVNFSHIGRKTSSVLFPFNLSNIDLHLNDEDISGPVIFGFILGFILMLTGKLHFGYIYGVSGIGCLSMYFLLNLMSETGLKFLSTTSVLGYCLLPIDLLALLALFTPFKILNFVIPLCILWSTLSSSLFCVMAAKLSHQRFLVAYPLFLLYSTFAILVIF